MIKGGNRAHTQSANQTGLGVQSSPQPGTTSQYNNSALGGQQSQQSVIIQRGDFFSEIERLKNLDQHRQKLESIQKVDPRRNVK